MKRSLAALFLLAAAPLLAGTTYDFHSETTGMQQSSIDGSVAVDGPNARMNVAHGDGMMFKDGSVVLSRDGGRTIDILDPAAKTYFELTIDQMTAGITATMKNAGLNIAFVNPVVNVKDGGDGGAVEGLPTRKSTLDATVDINVDAMGQTMTTKMSMHSESWTTDRLSANAMNVFQERTLQTGIDALDKLIAAQESAMKGRFPLKQVTTVHLLANGADLATTTTASVSNIKTATLPASTFATPAGYTRVDNPMERAAKSR
jgi:hypothetical protein